MSQLKTNPKSEVTQCSLCVFGIVCGVLQPMSAALSSTLVVGFTAKVISALFRQQELLKVFHTQTAFSIVVILAIII